MPSAFIIGGTGQIGRAVAADLAARGWDVRVGSRTPERAGEVALGGHGGLPDALGDGADLLVDCIAYDAADADALLDVQDRVGRIVAVSSASVYRDAGGRTLDEAGETGFPDLPVPIAEDHPTVAPGPATYSTRKIEMERRLGAARVPVTILRPCAIHGPGSRHAREWWFVKRLLDGRRRIPLGGEGRGVFQTTSTAAIARTVGAAADGGLPGVVNVTDADAPDVARIGRVIMDHLGRHAELVPLAGATPSGVGATPWSTTRPFVCASSAPNAGTYGETVGPALGWLLGIDPSNWAAALPQLAAYSRDHFDYAAEDAAME